MYTHIALAILLSLFFMSYLFRFFIFRSAIALWYKTKTKAWNNLLHTEFEKMKFKNGNQTFYSIIWFFCSNPYDIFVHTMLSWLLMILEIFIPWSCLSKSVLAKAFYYIHPDIKKVIFDIIHMENPAVFIVNVFWKINKTTYGTSS